MPRRPSKPSPKSSTSTQHAPAPAVQVVFDVDTFCESHHISKGTFYKLHREGRGPRIMRVGRRTLVTAEAAAEWRRRMEKETQDNG